jgi:hypothetical protein
MVSLSVHLLSVVNSQIAPRHGRCQHRHRAALSAPSSRAEAVPCALWCSPSLAVSLRAFSSCHVLLEHLVLPVKARALPLGDLDDSICCVFFRTFLVLLRLFRENTASTSVLFFGSLRAAPRRPSLKLLPRADFRSIFVHGGFSLSAIEALICCPPSFFGCFHSLL